MVNLLAAILVSAAVGFLAGHFSAKDNDPAPVSLKEAVTGEIDAPPAQFHLPRPPGPVMCEQGKTLQEQIAQLNFTEMKGICREAERNWQKQNIEDYAPMPARGVESDRAVRELFDLVKDNAVASERWRGEITLAQNGRTIDIEIFTTFSDNRPGGGLAKDGPTGPVGDPKDLCISISPFFVIDGKGMPTGSVSMCGGALRKRGNSFYFLWETHNDEMLAPVVNALLIPVPGMEAAFEYLNSQSGLWLRDSRFQWKPATSQEIVEAAQRHAKKVEGGKQ